jgi:hypothetical protein
MNYLQTDRRDLDELFNDANKEDNGRHEEIQTRTNS